MVEETKNMVSETVKDVQEVVKERFYSPMYFYFIISWIITNWKFVFALFFVNQDDLYIKKINYLVSFYPLSDFGEFIWTISKLILIPALSSYIFVWWFSRLAEKFYERNAQFRLNKTAIIRKLDYNEKKKAKLESIKLQKLEVEKQTVEYADNEDFNEDYDSVNELVHLSGNDFKPSELLYNTDYGLYIETLTEFKNNQEDSDNED